MLARRSLPIGPGNSREMIIGLRAAVWTFAAGVTFALLLAVDVATGELVLSVRGPSR